MPPPYRHGTGDDVNGWYGWFAHGVCMDLPWNCRALLTGDAVKPGVDWVKPFELFLLFWIFLDDMPVCTHCLSCCRRAYRTQVTISRKSGGWNCRPEPSRLKSYPHSFCWSSVFSFARPVFAGARWPDCFFIPAFPSPKNGRDKLQNWFHRNLCWKKWREYLWNRSRKGVPQTNLEAINFTANLQPTDQGWHGNSIQGVPFPAIGDKKRCDKQEDAAILPNNSK